MNQSIELLLIEASDPATSPERLRQLSERKRRHERARLRPVVAANPNADDELLCALAADFPKEVVGNPRFQLLQLSGIAWGEEWDLRSLCSLTLAAGKHAPPFLKPAIKSRCEEIYNQYSERVSIVRRESWRYARSIKILADESEGIAPFDIDLEVKFEILMEGSNDAWLESNENSTSFSRDWVASLLKALRNESIASLIEVFDPFSESFDIVVEDEVDQCVELTTNNAKLSVKDRSVILKTTGKRLFGIHVFYLYDKEALPSFVEGELQVPIFEHIGNGSRGGVSRGSNDDLGLLEPLWGWEPVFLAPEIPKSSWEKWVSAWIMD